MRGRPWGGNGQAVRGLVLGSVLLASGLAPPGLARAKDGSGDGAFTGGLLTLLRQPESMSTPGSETVVSDVQAFEAPHDQICDELTRAGLKLLVVGWGARDRVLHVFHDTERDRYVSVSGSWPSWVRLSDGMPSLRGYPLIAE